MSKKSLKSNIIQFKPVEQVTSKKDEYKADVKSLKTGELQKKYPKTYNSWRAMKNRAAKGLCTVHDELSGFKDFLLLLRPCPTDLGATGSYTLDRINPKDKEYKANKVEWATKQQQANNKTNVKRYEYKGQNLTLTEWAKVIGVSRQTLKKRIDKGFPYDKVFTLKPITHNEVKVASEWGVLPLHENSNIEKLEELYSHFYGGWTIRPVQLNRAEWLYYHFVRYYKLLSNRLADEWNPYKQGFDSEYWTIRNTNHTRLGEFCNEIKKHIGKEEAYNIRTLLSDKQHHHNIDVIKAYFGQII